MKTIDAVLLKKMIISGANELNKNRDLLDSLNVFPVPDGDTGSNMANTTIAAAAEVERSKSTSVEYIAKAASTGALFGARGNSGVILSQLFRGFAKGLEGKNTIDVDSLALALKKSSEVAYKAVMKPKEGTMLTVARMVSERAQQVATETDSMELMLNEILKHAHKVLAMTTDMLPQLKQAGVVDSGGKGIVCFLEGAYNTYFGKESAATATDIKPIENGFAEINADIEFGYCTEFFIISKAPLSEKKIKSITDFYTSIGDSLVVVSDELITKIHVHSNHPGKVLEKAIEYGSLSKIKIDNMREQHTSQISFDGNNASAGADESQTKEIGFIAVSAGQGLSKYFRDLGVDIVIEGGQTMNPSTEDIVTAAKKINAKNIIVLPNNKNIVLAAELAATLIEDKNIYSLNTKTIPEGINAMVAFRSDLSAQENLELMAESFASVKTGLVTIAVRDTKVDDQDIFKGDILGIIKGKIVSVGRTKNAVATELLDKLVDDDSSIISVFYGEDTPQDEAEKLLEKLSETYTDVDIDLQDGAQPVYYYIISVE